MPSAAATEATQLQVLAALLMLHDDLTLVEALMFLNQGGYLITDSGLILIPGGFDTLRTRFQAMQAIITSLKA